MRRRLFVLALILICSILGASPASESLQEQLKTISDKELKTTLINSIVAGLIEDQRDFDAAVSAAEKRANKNSPVFYSARSGRNLSTVRKEIERN